METKFKVGDRVRCIDATNSCGRLKETEIYMVAEVQESFIRLKNIENWFDPTRFEKSETQKQPSELEQLVATANAGLAAYYELYQNHRGEIEIESFLIQCRWEPICSNHNIGAKLRTLRIKPKPKFEPYIIDSTGWQVELDDENTIHLGCQSFNVTWLKQGLQALIDRNYSRYESLHATRSGVTRDEKTLPWADAEELYNKLKELGDV